MECVHVITVCIFASTVSDSYWIMAAANPHCHIVVQLKCVGQSRGWSIVIDRPLPPHSSTGSFIIAAFCLLLLHCLLWQLSSCFVLGYIWLENLMPLYWHCCHYCRPYLCTIFTGGGLQLLTSHYPLSVMRAQGAGGSPHRDTTCAPVCPWLSGWVHIRTSCCYNYNDNSSQWPSGHNYDNIHKQALGTNDSNDSNH